MALRSRKVSGTFEKGPGCSKDKGITLVLLTLVQLLAIYPVDRVIQPSNNWDQLF